MISHNFHFNAEQNQRIHTDGLIDSDPRLSKPEEGKRLIETDVAEMLEDYKKFLRRSELSQ